MKFLLAGMFALVTMFGMATMSGCASGTVNVISDQALERLDDSQRAKYRDGLDKADLGLDTARTVIDKAKETVGQAKDAYDAKYNPDGTPIVPADPTE